MDSDSPFISALFLVRQLLGRALFRIKRLVSLTAQAAQRDEIRELTNEARVLGSASAESIDHVGAELREINGRLSKLEADLERVGRLLEERAGTDLGPERHGEAAAGSLTSE
jgi:hypothetical protein